MQITNSIPLFIRLRARDSWTLGAQEIKREALANWLQSDGRDVKYVHLSSSACLTGMGNQQIPSDSRGYLLPGGEMALYGIEPASGEGIASAGQLKYHSVAVCAVQPDLEDAMNTLEAYSRTPGFIADGDYPVVFAINTPGEMTCDINDMTKPIIDPGMEKMDRCEFAIRDYVPVHEITAIIVPEHKINDAVNRLRDCPDLSAKVIVLAG
ncbi:MAG: hypothetical protein ACRCZ6_17825 [Kluyvera sp.]|uniref:hypothetical protein n=1 Tax=Kluyvera sp. TaxID=1538228 RepID=UPI003F324B58